MSSVGDDGNNRSNRYGKRETALSAGLWTSGYMRVRFNWTLWTNDAVKLDFKTRRRGRFMRPSSVVFRIKSQDDRPTRLAGIVHELMSGGNIRHRKHGFLVGDPNLRKSLGFQVFRPLRTRRRRERLTRAKCNGLLYKREFFGDTRPQC